MNGSEEDKLEQEGGLPDGQSAEPEGAAEPHDLAEAFAQYRAQNAQASEPSVPASEDAGDTGSADPDGYAAEPAGGSEPPVVEPVDDGYGGGSTDGYEENDYSSYRQGLIDEINKAAFDTVARNFQKQGIQKVSVSQLYQRDEDRGTVSFVNPDNQNRPFESRAEAQAWCEAFNKDVDMEFRKAAQAERNRLMSQYRPTMELIDFAPKFDTFDKVKQDVLDDLIEPYAITDTTGKIIGYRCNLDAAAAQADKIIERFGTAKSADESQSKVNTGSEPALDMKSHGAAGGGKSKEPKTLEEAMRMVQEEKRK